MLPVVEIKEGGEPKFIFSYKKLGYGPLIFQLILYNSTEHVLISK